MASTTPRSPSAGRLGRPGRLGRLSRSADDGYGDDYDPTTSGRSPWRRPGFVVSGVVLAGLLIAAVVLFVLPPADPGTAAPAPQPSASQPAPSAPPTAQPSEPPADPAPAADASVCGLAPGAQSIPTTAPAAQWVLVGTTAVPTDPTGAGPGTTADDGFASCFSHDPTGALFAGINWWAQTLNGRAVQVYEELTAATPERDAALEAGLDESSEGVGQVAGYRFVDTAEDRVLVELAFETPDGQYFSVPTPVRWEDGDWKFVLSASGDVGLSPLPDLTGFTPWSGIA